MFLEMGTKVEQLLWTVTESNQLTLSTSPHPCQSFEAHGSTSLTIGLWVEVTEEPSLLCWEWFLYLIFLHLLQPPKTSVLLKENGKYLHWLKASL